MLNRARATVNQNFGTDPIATSADKFPRADIYEDIFELTLSREPRPPLTGPRGIEIFRSGSRENGDSRGNSFLFFARTFLLLRTENILQIGSNVSQRCNHSDA